MTLRHGLALMMYVLASACGQSGALYLPDEPESAKPPPAAEEAKPAPEEDDESRPGPE